MRIPSPSKGTEPARVVQLGQSTTWPDTKSPRERQPGHSSCSELPCYSRGPFPVLTETALHCVFTPPDGSLTSDPPLRKPLPPSAGGSTMDSPFGFEAIPACWKFSVLTAQGFYDRTPCEGRSKDRPAQYSELTGSGDGVRVTVRGRT